VLKPIGLLIAFSFLLWMAVAIPGRRLAGEWVVVYSGTAALVCVVPAVVTLAWAYWAARRSPESFMVIVLAGTGVRLFVVSTAALVFESSFEYFREHEGFWIWLLVFYLATLALEMSLLLSTRPGGHK
jgi:hypothetical protein